MSHEALHGDELRTAAIETENSLLEQRLTARPTNHFFLVQKHGALNETTFSGKNNQTCSADEEI